MGANIELGTSSANKRRYIIRSFSQQHAGDYVCKASNVYGDVSEKTTTIHMLGRYNLYYNLYII